MVMTEPTLSDILKAYEDPTCIVERRWRNGGVKQYKIDADGQPWEGQMGYWERVNLVGVKAPVGGSIRIIRPRTRDDVVLNPMVGDRVRGPANAYTVLYVDEKHMLVEYESDPIHTPNCGDGGAYWSRKSWANFGVNWLEVTPIQVEAL